MPRILIAGLFHETHTFLEGTTPLSQFAVLSGAKLLATKGDVSPMGAVLELADELGWEMIPAVDYRAQPSAIVEDEVIESFWQGFVENAQPALTEGVDAIYLVLHGAMAAQSLVDVEGEILERLRRLPGAEKVPVFGVFDLHANFTARMAALADCLVGYRENPHTDARECGLIAAKLLDRCLRTGERPKMHWRHSGVMWPPTGTGTATDPMKALESMARAMEKEPGVWAVNVIAGFSFADTPDTGVSFTVATTGSDAEAAVLLNQLCDQTVAMRELGNTTEQLVGDVLHSLFPIAEGLTVLVEPSDNIGGGAPGDGTGLLRAFIHWRVPNCAVCIADAEAVAKLAHLPKGQRITLPIGGKGSRLDAGPMELEVEVISHSNGKFDLEDPQSHLASMHGRHIDMGPTSVVRHKDVTILLTSLKTPPFDLGQWRSQGLEPKDFSVIGVKAAVAHRRAYDSITARMIWVDTPGPCSSNLKALPFEKIRRPIYPLDE
ncbi:MAG: M81 family metallopeptidase [Prosthecobacter sp.]|nr:M81 family metallopeptidase [Prosthecobacter sp.]